MSKNVGTTLGVILAIPIMIIIFTVGLLGVGLLGYSVGWVMELIASPLIYAVLDVVPTQPFSKGDFPKLLAILSLFGGVPAFKSIGGMVKDE